MIAGTAERVMSLLVLDDPNMFLYYRRADCMSIEVLEEYPDNVLIKAGFPWERTGGMQG
jgi:hypothetical protein